tara:strand:+ start:817 stop:1242 length:426 start_codon:yes stop_codon:yes gene_type:complete
MSVGFTGTQDGLTEKQSANLKEALQTLMRYSDFHHGDCIGADAQAHEIAVSLNYRIILHPPSNSNKRAFCLAHETRKPIGYLDRNTEIVKETKILIACPKEMTEQLRSGTWSTVRRAKKFNRNILILFPDGSIKKEKKDDN